MALSKFLRVVDKAFDILTSTELYNKNPWKNALDVNIEEQRKVLLELYDYIDKMKFLGPNGRTKCPFQKALKISIKVALQLQEELKNNFGIPYLLTSRIVQG